MRLEELTTEITRLEDARAALRTRTLAPLPTTAAPSSTKRAARRRIAVQTKNTARKHRPPAADPQPEPAGTAAAGSKSEAPKPRRRSSAAPTSRTRPVSSLSAEQLERLLADARSGLSAGAIAEQADVGYSRVLARLRDLEAAGKVRRTGSRRSTLWLLITDEDRIAQRTAELERLMAARPDDRTQRQGRARAS